MNSASPKTISYLALGDSYTIGEGIAPSENFPFILLNELKKKNISVSESKIIATTGWTTTDLKNELIDAHIDRKEYDIVSLLIGANNQFQGKSIEEYEEEFTELLLISIGFAGGNKDKIFVISIPDYGYTPFGKSKQAEISKQIDQFNTVNKNIADSFGVKYFDITSISRKGFLDPELITSDDLHPSDKMYKLWVDLMIDDVVKMCGS